MDCVGWHEKSVVASVLSGVESSPRPTRQNGDLKRFTEEAAAANGLPAVSYSRAAQRNGAVRPRGLMRRWPPSIGHFVRSAKCLTGNSVSRLAERQAY